MVTLVGLRRGCGAEGYGRCERKQRSSGCGMRGAWIDRGDYSAESGIAGDHLREGAAAVCSVFASDGIMDAGLSDCVDLGGGAGFCCSVGGDGAELICHVPELPWDAGNAD